MIAFSPNCYRPGSKVALVGMGLSAPEPPGPQGKGRGVGAGALGTPEAQRRGPPPSPSKRTWEGLEGGAEERTRSPSASLALSLLLLALSTPLGAQTLARAGTGAAGKFPLGPRQAVTMCSRPSATRHPDKTHGSCPPAWPVGAPSGTHTASRVSPVGSGGPRRVGRDAWTREEGRPCGQKLKGRGEGEEGSEEGVLGPAQ